MFQVADCRSLPFPDDHFDLVFCSPPYESQRTYGIDFNLRGQDWVNWAMECYSECLRVCKGLVCWVVEGQTRQFEYSATPFRLMIALQDAGFHIRKPPIYQRYGTPGSGGPDWLRNDYEPIICAQKHKGRLPWSDNTAAGWEPKYKTGRPVTARTKNGRRQRGKYFDVDKANPGNLVSGSNSGGHLGHELAHQNEAPMPQWLAAFFVQSFCPPGGRVLDPFSGSGTTVDAAYENGRLGFGTDIRESQVSLSRKRMAAPA